MGWLAGPLNVLILLLGIFLILLVLIQRGKGGGLVGALSGVGGSSPFGSRAGDAFTRITIYVAAFWILLLMVQVRVMNRPSADTGGAHPLRRPRGGACRTQPAARLRHPWRRGTGDDRWRAGRGKDSPG